MGYTASDLLAVGVGFLLFGLFAFAPGYTFGWLSNVFGFRQRRGDADYFPAPNRRLLRKT
jgi:hypothetical protein